MAFIEKIRFWFLAWRLAQREPVPPVISFVSILRHVETLKERGLFVRRAPDSPRDQDHLYIGSMNEDPWTGLDFEISFSLLLHRDRFDLTEQVKSENLFIRVRGFQAWGIGIREGQIWNIQRLKKFLGGSVTVSKWDLSREDLEALKRIRHEILTAQEERLPRGSLKPHEASLA